MKLDYTIAEGGAWTRAKLDETPQDIAAHLAENLTGPASDGWDMQRRVKIFVRTKKSAGSQRRYVEAVAVRLADGRVFDAILGGFRP